MQQSSIAIGQIGGAVPIPLEFPEFGSASGLVGHRPCQTGMAHPESVPIRPIHNAACLQSLHFTPLQYTTSQTQRECLKLFSSKARFAPELTSPRPSSGNGTKRCTFGISSILLGSAQFSGMSIPQQPTRRNFQGSHIWPCIRGLAGSGCSRTHASSSKSRCIATSYLARKGLSLT